MQVLDFLLNSDVNPIDIDCNYYHFPKESVSDYLTCGRKNHLIHLVTRGEREYFFEENRFVFGEHSVIFIPDGTRYRTISHEKNEQLCEGATVIFEASPYINIPHGIYQISTFSKSDIEALFFELCDTDTAIPTQKLRKKILTLEILYWIISKLTLPNKSRHLIKPALEYIALHYKENLDVSKYASVCNLSESYFRKKFLEYTGLTPIEYRNHLRFAEAKRLYQSGYSTKTIAYEVGFCDENYLSKLYKKYYNSSLKEDCRFQ